jgi:pilus assembly protein CpaE
LKISVISPDEKHLADIGRLLGERKSPDKVDAIVGTLEKSAVAIDRNPPDVLVLDQPSAHGGDLALVEQLSHSHPQVAFIVLCREHTPEFLLQAMRAGIREVLLSPVSGQSLLPAIARIEEKLNSRSLTNGKVLAFISCKGGSGATFLATNLAYALSLHEKSRVALLDLNLQFGDASLFVSDQKPLATLSNVCQQIHRLDGSFLASSMLNISPNYSVLAAPEDPTQANDIKPEHIDAILRLARRQYDFIVLDVGRSLDPVSIRALDQADMIFPVVQTTLPYIRDGKRLMGIFRSLDYRRDKIQLVVNRHQNNSDIRLQDLKAAFGLGEFITIPNHYAAAAASVAQGTPLLMLTKKSSLSKALQEFAQSLQVEKTHAPKRWLTRFFAPAASTSTSTSTSTSQA